MVAKQHVIQLINFQAIGSFIIHMDNHWSNENAMLEYIREVIIPFVKHKWVLLELSEDQPALVIFDHFKGQLRN